MALYCYFQNFYALFKVTTSHTAKKFYTCVVEGSLYLNFMCQVA